MQLTESFVVYEDPASDLNDDIARPMTRSAAAEAAQPDDTLFDDKENAHEAVAQPSAPVRRALLTQPAAPALPKHRSKAPRMPFEDVTSIYAAQQDDKADDANLTECLAALSLSQVGRGRCRYCEGATYAHQDGKQQQQRKPVATSTHHKSKAKTYCFSMEAAVRSIR